MELSHYSTADNIHFYYDFIIALMQKHIITLSSSKIKTQRKLVKHLDV